MVETLLIVDDDKEICELLADTLTKYGYKSLTASDGQQMFQILSHHPVDLIVLDVMLPGEDGFSLCRQLRGKSTIPIIMLTAIGEETDRIIGLEVGADDYVPKPFNARELIARIKAVLRRSQHMPAHLASVVAKPSPAFSPSEELKQFAGWELSLATRRLVSPDNIEVGLSAGEYDLLLAFIHHPQRVLSRDQLLEYTRNREAAPFDRSIDIQVSRLRQKIELNTKKPKIIKTVRGGGYMFTAKVENQVQQHDG